MIVNSRKKVLTGRYCPSFIVQLPAVGVC